MEKITTLHTQVAEILQNPPGRENPDQQGAALLNEVRQLRNQDATLNKSSDLATPNNHAIQNGTAQNQQNPSNTHQRIRPKNYWAQDPKWNIDPKWDIDPKWRIDGKKNELQPQYNWDDSDSEDENVTTTA